jgi:hypothetical protein
MTKSPTINEKNVKKVFPYLLHAIGLQFKLLLRCRQFYRQCSKLIIVGTVKSELLLSFQLRDSFLENNVRLIYFFMFSKDVRESNFYQYHQK